MKFYDRLQERTAADRAGLLGINIIQDALCGRIELRQYVAFLTRLITTCATRRRC